MALGARSRLWAGHRRPGGRFFCGSPMLATKGGSRRRRDAAGPAVPPPPPATPPFDRSHGVAITPAPLSRGRRAACRRHTADRPRSRRPRPPKRAAGTFRGPRPLAMAGGDARHQLAFPPAMAHLAASLGRACPPPSAAMQDMDSVARNHLARFAGVGEPRPPALPPGPCRAAPRSLPAKPRGRHAAPRSLLPRAGRALRHSRARGEGRGPRPQRPRPFSRSSRAISRASAIATRMPRSVNLITRPVARFTAKPSAAPLILRTRPSALER